MTKKNNANAKPATLDWNAEARKIEASAKEKGGSRGDFLGRVGKLVAGDTPASTLIRTACGDAGAEAIIQQPRNVLAKLGKLAGCIAAGTPWCSLSALDPANKRKEDASVVVALASLGGGSDRQKAVVADAVKRYPGGANAQMPAALESLAFFGIVQRKEGGARNAAYVVADAKRAEKLIPTS